MPVTLRDVAKQAGCALSTASNVLNKKERMFPISERTKQKVMQAAQELGYHANAAAKSLRKQKSNTIGLIYSANLAGMRDDLARDVMGGVGKTLDASDYNLLVYGGFEDIKQRIISAAASKSIDGLLYFIHTSTYDLFHSEIVEDLNKLSIPVMGIQLFERHEQTRSVGLRSKNSSAIAVKHLHGLGHKRIGFISSSPARLIGHQELLSGFQQTCTELKINAEHSYAIESIGGNQKNRYREGRLFAKHIIEADELQDAYFIASDVLAAGFKDELNDRGYSVPGDVAIVASGNVLDEYNGSDFFTTIDTKRQGVAELAAKRLLELIEHKDKYQEEFICLEPGLIIKKSCGSLSAQRE